MPIRASAFLLVCASVLGCAAADSLRPGSTLEAVWSGADSGSFRARPAARWCGTARFGELLAVRGDTGLAIAIRNADSLAPARYAAVLPGSADSATASAAVALRFLARTTVSGYQSDSGWVTLERDAAGRLGASFDVGARLLGAVGRIRLRGRATGVPVTEGGAACAPLDGLGS